MVAIKISGMTGLAVASLVTWSRQRGIAVPPVAIPTMGAGSAAMLLPSYLLDALLSWADESGATVRVAW